MPFEDRRNRSTRRLPTAMKIPDSFAAVTLTDAKTLFPALEDAHANRPFIEGDHFQDGEAWVGPGPRPGSTNYRDFVQLLEDAFVSKNVLSEGCNRLTGAVIGWEPRWGWVPRRHDLEENPMTKEEIAAIQELEEWMTDWWDKRQIHKLLKRLIFQMLWAKESTWRLYVPSGRSGADGSVQSTSLEEAFDKIYLDIPAPEDATVFEHPETKQKLGIVLIRRPDNTELVELCYLEDDGKTRIRIVGANPSDADTTTTAAVDFQKHLTIYAVRLDEPLIREQERSLQKALNMTLTLLEKGLVDNHFLERLFTNALPPGEWVVNPDGSRKYFKPASRTTGGNTDTYLQGIDYEDQDATTGQKKTTIKDPGVTIRQPLDPNGTIGGAEYWYQALLEAMRQDHILINQLATPSGKSREHSRGDFIDSTKDPVMQADLAGRELLFTAACMAEAFMGQVGKWTSKFKPIFKCRPNYGPLSVAERQQNVVEAEKGLLSDETVMALNGLDDVDAELALISQTPRAKLAQASLEADVIIKWATDFPREVALHKAGYSKEQITEIMGMVSASKSADPGEIPKITDDSGNEPAPAKSAAGTRIKPAGNRPSTRAAANNAR